MLHSISTFVLIVLDLSTNDAVQTVLKQVIASVHINSLTYLLTYL